MLTQALGPCLFSHTTSYHEELYFIFLRVYGGFGDDTESIASTFIPEDRARRVDFQGTERWVVSGYLASSSSLPYVNLVV